jgi:hypothetical protein
VELLLKVNLGKSFTCFLLPPHDGLYHLRTQPSRSSPDEAPQPCTRTVSWNKSYLCNLPSLQYCVISYRKQTTVRVTHHPLVIVGSKIDANWRARICFLKQINLNLERNNLREGSLSECLLSNWVYISTWEKKRKKKDSFTLQCLYSAQRIFHWNLLRLQTLEDQVCLQTPVSVQTIPTITRTKPSVVSDIHRCRH